MPVSYRIPTITELLLLPAFDAGLAGLRDRVAKKRIVARLARLANGNAGDVRAVGEGVSELRIDHGPGYRVYFIARGPALVVVLGGGDKSSQRADIANALAPARALEGP